MKFDDLPYKYRVYAVATRGWEEETALSYWRQAAEYREYAVSSVIDGMKHSQDMATYQTLDSVLPDLRGSRVKLS